MNTLKLQRVGKNSFGNMAYKDENGRFYLDIDMINGKNPKTLYRCSPSDDMDGEPDCPLRVMFEILNPFTDMELRMQKFNFEYSMLSRLKDECEAFVGKTGCEQKDKWDCRYRNVHNIWGDTIENHIAEMKRLYDMIPEDIKPEWCTADDIAELERKTKAL